MRNYLQSLWEGVSMPLTLIGMGRRMLELSSKCTKGKVLRSLVKKIGKLSHGEGCTHFCWVDAPTSTMAARGNGPSADTDGPCSSSGLKGGPTVGRWPSAMSSSSGIPERGDIPVSPHKARHKKLAIIIFYFFSGGFISAFRKYIWFVNLRNYQVF